MSAPWTASTNPPKWSGHRNRGGSVGVEEEGEEEDICNVWKVRLRGGKVISGRWKAEGKHGELIRDNQLIRISQGQNGQKQREKEERHGQ